MEEPWGFSIFPNWGSGKKPGGAKILFRGGSRIFSKKNIKNFVDQIDFLSLLKSLYFDQVVCSAGKFLNKPAKKGVLGTFCKFLSKKCVFFGARSPSQLALFGHENAFRNILGLVSQQWISQNSTMGALSQQGVGILNQLVEI